jgi:hypothetical protein
VRDHESTDLAGAAHLAAEDLGPTPGLAGYPRGPRAIDRYDLLAAARSECRRIEDEHQKAALDSGDGPQSRRHALVEAAASRAEEAIFWLLNVTSSYLDPDGPERAAQQGAQAVLHVTDRPLPIVTNQDQRPPEGGGKDSQNGD